MRRVAAGLVVLAWSAGARAQVAPPAPEAIAVGDWRLWPVAEVRMFGEGRHDVDAGDHGTLTERVRLGVGAERGPLEMRVVLQDARLWDLAAGEGSIGQPAQLAATGAYEAWVEAHTAGSAPTFARAGRQPITWGEGRLLGVADRSPTGRTLDAVRGRWVLGAWSLEALGASLSDPVPPAGSLVGTAYGELAGARAEWALGPLFGVEAYGLGRFAQINPATNLEGTVGGETYTAALRLHGDGHGWSWGAEGALQLGHVTSLDVDRQAWATAGRVGYAFEHTMLSPAVRLGGSYASGGPATSQVEGGSGTRYRQFDPLLPDTRTWHGAMDLLSWSNEIEGNARASIAPWTDGAAAVEYRYARMADTAGAWRSDYLLTIAPAGSSKSAELGHEVDASLGWAPWPGIELGLGYSILVLGDGARAALAAEHLTSSSLAHLGFGQITARLP